MTICANLLRPCYSIVTMRLRAIIIITNADLTLALETFRPETANLDISLRHTHVGEQEPCTKDRLGKNVEDGVGNDLIIDGSNARTIGNAPDATILLVE